MNERGNEPGGELVLLAMPELLDSAKIASVLGPFKRIPYQDAIRLSRRCWGVVSREMNASAAEGLKTALNSAGLQSLVVAERSLLELPPPQPVKKIQMEADTIEDLTPAAPAVPSGPRSLRWKKLSVLALAAFTETSASKINVKEGPDAAERAMNMGIMMATGLPIKIGKKERVVEKTVESANLVFHIQLVFEDPRARLHINAQNFDYSCLGSAKQYNVLANVRVLAAELARRAPAAYKSRGARLLLENRPVREMGYESLADLEQESRWLRTIHSIMLP